MPTRHRSGKTILKESFHLAFSSCRDMPYEAEASTRPESMPTSGPFSMTIFKRLHCCVPVAMLATLASSSGAEQHSSEQTEIPTVRLAGTILQGSAGQGIALVSIAGSRFYLLPVGGGLTSSWRIARVDADEVTIRSDDGRSQRVVIGAGIEPLALSSTRAEHIRSPEKSPTFPTPALIHAANVEFDLPAND